MQRLTRQESQQRTRERLRQSAAAIIARTGVRGAGIEEIARDAGYSRGAFYSNYQGKPELLIDMLEDRQIAEIRLWNDMFEQAPDLDQVLTETIGKSEDMVRILERNMITLELQLEAERNPEFRPHFQRYLDDIYAEMRRYFTTILHRHGKAAPHDLDAFVVVAFQFGLNLGSTAVLGSALAERTTAAALMNQFMNRMIEAAPPLGDAASPPTDRDISGT